MGRHRRNIDEEPEILVRPIVGHEPSGVLIGADQSFDGDIARHLPVGAGFRVLAVEGNPAAVDQRDEPVIAGKGRHHVIADIAVERARGEIHFLVVKEMPGQLHMPVFDLLDVGIGGRWCDRWTADPFGPFGDERQFPFEPVHLPRAERQENDQRRNGEKGGAEGWPKTETADAEFEIKRAARHNLPSDV